MESTGQQDDTVRLIGILRLAYSGEKAAGYAYRGHWRSLPESSERTQIKIIENEEWHHRNLVGEMLAKLGAGPNPRRELRAGIVGRVLGFFCHLSGWLAPMYGAGKLESKNIVEYETAARYARDSGHKEFVDCLLTMAEVEWEHEAFFRACVVRHWLGHRLSIWPQPPPKENIRRSFAHEVMCPAEVPKLARAFGTEEARSDEIEVISGAS
jgi:hypothetical protein